MSNLELLAIMPATDAEPPDNRLQFVTSGGFTGIFGLCPQEPALLPPSRKRALAHAADRQAMLEACMPMGPLLVVRPGYQLSRADLASLITANRPLLDQQCQRFRGLVQYQVMISWSPAGVLTHFRDAPELACIFETGQTTQEALTISLNALATRLAYQMVQALSAVSQDLLQLPPDADMLVNAVVLVRQQDVAKLDEAVEAIDAIWSDGLKIRQIGPAPAASFALLDPVQVKPAQALAAAGRLGLTTPFDGKAIASARKQALISRPGDAEQIKQDADIAAAVVRSGTPDSAFWLCTVRSDDQAQTSFSRKAA